MLRTTGLSQEPPRHSSMGKLAVVGVLLGISGGRQRICWERLLEGVLLILYLSLEFWPGTACVDKMLRTDH